MLLQPVFNLWFSFLFRNKTNGLLLIPIFWQSHLPEQFRIVWILTIGSRNVYTETPNTCSVFRTVRERCLATFQQQSCMFGPVSVSDSPSSTVGPHKQTHAGTVQNWFSSKSRRSLLQERLLSVCNNQLLNYKQNSTVYSGQSNVAYIRPTDIPTGRKVLTCSHSFTSAKAEAPMTTLRSRLVYAY